MQVQRGRYGRCVFFVERKNFCRTIFPRRARALDLSSPTRAKFNIQPEIYLLTHCILCVVSGVVKALFINLKRARAIKRAVSRERTRNSRRPRVFPVPAIAIAVPGGRRVDSLRAQ